MAPISLSKGTVTALDNDVPADPVIPTECPGIDSSHIKVDPASGFKYIDNILKVRTNKPLNATEQAELLKTAGATSILCKSERPATTGTLPPFGRYTLEFSEPKSLASLSGAAQRLLSLETYVTDSNPDYLNLVRPY